MYKLLYKTIIIFSIIGIIWPTFTFSQKLPENFEDVEGIGKGILDKIWQGIKGAWEEAVKIWKKIWGWFKNLWNKYIFPFLKFIFEKISNFFIKIWEKIKELI